jgi:hypothetical protein
MVNLARVARLLTMVARSWRRPHRPHQGRVNPLAPFQSGGDLADALRVDRAAARVLLSLRSER